MHARKSQDTIDTKEMRDELLLVVVLPKRHIFTEGGITDPRGLWSIRNSAAKRDLDQLLDRLSSKN